MRVDASSTLRILDFDTECRPMHYSEWRAESQITGIAWSWVGSDAIRHVTLWQDLANERDMLEVFLADFNAADIVTGHYIRKHDLPLLNDHCIRLGFPTLKPKLVSDTMQDLYRVNGLGKSQENLSETLGVDAGKFTMNGAKWRVANTLDEAGQEGTRKRVVSDVLQNKQLRATLLERGLLKPPRIWRP